jgi:hypothetical protein
MRKAAASVMRAGLASANGRRAKSCACKVKWASYPIYVDYRIGYEVS